MASSPTSPGQTVEEWREQQRPRGVVSIRLPGNRDGWSASSSSTVDEESVSFLDGAAFDGDEAKRPQKTLSLRRAAGTVLALAALAVAGYFSLYAGADPGAAWGSLVAREEDRGDRLSFLLPLYPKARGGVRAGAGGGTKENLTAAVFPLAGNVFPDGYYYTTISIGNPPKPYFLDVDTGSDFTWVQCAPRVSCAKGAHPLYRPARGNIVPPSDSLCQEVPGNLKPDSTSKQCDYDIKYADESSSLGVLARDSMQLVTEDGEWKNVDIMFGCGYNQQGNLLASLANTDGILGLSGAEISLPTQLASKGIISNVFGHCITTDPSGGGYLFLGDEYIPRWGMTWVPIINGPGFSNRYSAEVQKLSHGAEELSVRGKAGRLTRLIFDSGSTYTYFPHEAYSNLIAVLKDVSPRFVQDDSDKTLPFCMKADFPVRSVDDVKSFFKPLSLHFKNRLFILPRTFTLLPQDYLIINEKGNVCLGVLDGTEILGSAILLGDVSLRGYLVVYDNDENQIGWVRSDCTNPRKQSGFRFLLRKSLGNQYL